MPIEQVNGRAPDAGKRRRLPSPPRQRVYIPERLAGLLEQRVATGVLQVQAPAGCGKTAVILQFLYDQGLEPRWYICEAEDAEPANLLAGLVRGIGGADSNAGKTAIAALTSLRAGQSYRVAL